jgi:outer membrane protein assembly factor BamB
MVSHWSTPVCHDGYLYGMFGFKEHRNGPIKCIELSTGKEMWSAPGFGPGGVIFIDGNILATGDQGQLVLIEATPKKYTELARATPLSYKVWTMPVVSNGRVFHRNTNEAICLDLSGK